MFILTYPDIAEVPDTLDVFDYLPFDRVTEIYLVLTLHQMEIDVFKGIFL